MNIVFMGAKSIGLSCLKMLQEYLYKYSEHKLVAVLSNDRDEGITEFAQVHRIKVLKSLDDYLNLSDINLLLSVQYHQIFQPHHLDVADININLHMAPLPEYRGCNQFSLAILDKKDYFGTTLHLINEDIDAGDIIFERRFSIPTDIWVSELYELTLHESLKLFSDAIPKMLREEFQPLSQTDRIQTHGSTLCYRHQIEHLKQVDLAWGKDRIERTIRATSMPGFDSPYAWVGGKKIYMSYCDD